MDVGIVRLDRMGDLLHHGGLACLGGRHDQAALSLSDGREQVDDTSGEVVLVAGLRHLEMQPGVGEERREVLETGAIARLFGIETRHRVDAQQRWVLLVVGGRAAGSLDVVALPQREPPRLADGDVDVLGRWQVAAAAQEPIALVAQIEHALDLDQLAGVRLLLAAAALQLAADAALPAAPAPAAPVPDVATVALGLAVLIVAIVLIVLVLSLMGSVPVLLVRRRTLPVLVRRVVPAGVGELGWFDEHGWPGRWRRHEDDGRVWCRCRFRWRRRRWPIRQRTFRCGLSLPWRRVSGR